MDRLVGWVGWYDGFCVCLCARDKERYNNTNCAELRELDFPNCSIRHVDLGNGQVGGCVGVYMCLSANDIERYNNTNCEDLRELDFPNCMWI